MHIPTLSIVFCAISAGISIGLPLFLLILCCVKAKRNLTAPTVGALCFIVSVLVLESLLHQLVFSLVPMLPYKPFLYTFYGCLAAGFFEETARLIGLKFLCRRDASASTGLAYGIGHGGIESILLTGTGLVSTLVLMLRVNFGDMDALLSSVDAAQQPLAQQQLEAIIATPAFNLLAGGIERIGAIALHIALSMLIWMVVTKRLPAWFYFVAVGLHALANVGAALYQVGVLRNVWLVETLLLVVVTCVCFFVLRLYKQRAALPVNPADTLTQE